MIMMERGTSCRLFLVPLNAVVELDARAPKAVQRAAYRQVDLPSTEPLDEIKILQVSASAGVRHRDGAPFRKPLHELFVYTLLQAFVVCRMDQEFRTVRLQRSNRLLTL